MSKVGNFVQGMLYQKKKKKENREELKREHQNFAKQRSSAEREIYKGKCKLFFFLKNFPIQ